MARPMAKAPSYYDEPDDQQDAVNPPDAGDSGNQGDQGGQGDETENGPASPEAQQIALLPKTFFGGEPKVGDTREVRVLKVLPAEIQVQVVDEGQSSEAPPTDSSAAEPATGGDTGSDMYA